MKVYVLFTLEVYTFATPVERFRGLFKTRKDAKLEGERLLKSKNTKTTEFKIISQKVV